MVGKELGSFHHGKTRGSSSSEQKPLLSSKALKKNFFFFQQKILKIALHLTFKIVFDPTLLQLCSLLQTHSIP